MRLIKLAAKGKFCALHCSFFREDSVNDIMLENNLKLTFKEAWSRAKNQNTNRQTFCMSRGRWLMLLHSYYFCSGLFFNPVCAGNPPTDMYKWIIMFAARVVLPGASPRPWWVGVAGVGWGWGARSSAPFVFIWCQHSVYMQHKWGLLQGFFFSLNPFKIYVFSNLISQQAPELPPYHGGG